MKKLADREEMDPEVLDRLKAYTALDNPIRLRAFRLIHASPGVPITTIKTRALDGAMRTPMLPANRRTSPRMPARMLVFLFRTATCSCTRRRSATLEGFGSTVPHSSKLI